MCHSSGTALALFLPRATLPTSRFGFVMVDDPVHAMDPAKVDGLARVLERIGRTHQVIVFTHDDRLPEAVRRIGIDARILLVSRSVGSRVEVTTGSDPTSRYFDEAHAVARDRGVDEVVWRAGHSAAVPDGGGELVSRPVHGTPLRAW